MPQTRLSQVAGILVFLLATQLLPLGSRSPVVQAGVVGEYLILWNSYSQYELDQTAEQVTALGGDVLATFPEQGMFARLSPAAAEAVRMIQGIRWMGQGPASIELAEGNLGAQAAILAWNRRISSDPQVDYLSTVEMPPGDALQARDSILPAADSGLETGTGAITQTSEYLLGSIQVDVFLPESTGKVDPDLEDWTAVQINRVIEEVSAGVSWWLDTARLEGSLESRLSANINFHTPLTEPAFVAVGTEPITYGWLREEVWMGEVLSHYGYSGEYFEALRQYVHDRRVNSGRDWGFTIWVANSAADLDGRFSDGRFAYGYIFGPAVVMTYDNNGWGISNMEIVTAHEIGHTFGALDEYAASNCVTTDRSGYLHAANTNCENGALTNFASIMRGAVTQFTAYPNHLVSPPVKEMVGWRDLDGDRLFDPIDTTPYINLTSLPADPSATTTPTWIGIAHDIPFPSPTRAPLSINQVGSVTLTVVDGPSTECSLTRDSADDLRWEFSCTAPPLPEGHHSVLIAAANSAGSTTEMGVGVNITSGFPVTIYSPMISPRTTIPVWWGSAIELPELLLYDVQVRHTGLPDWVDWLTASNLRSAVFGPQCPVSGYIFAPGDQIRFRVRVRYPDGIFSEFRETKTILGYGIFFPILMGIQPLE